LILVGCQGTLHTRWAQKSDSYNYWSPLMSAMPVDVRGAIPGTSHADTVAHIPQGFTTVSYVANHPASSDLNAAPRIVLYIGGDRLPTDATYCGASPVMRDAINSGHGIMVASALCDGPRLVVRSRREVNIGRLDATDISTTIRTLKSRLLFGLTISQAQMPVEQDHG
jgi:hypothetical protein